MTTHTTLRGPGELIAAVPQMLGYTPREEIAVVSLKKTGDVGPVMCVERSRCAIPEGAWAAANACAAPMAKALADKAILISYTDGDVQLGCDAADALRDALSLTTDVIDVWAVRQGRYFAPGCATLSCCPPGGRAVPDIRHKVAAFTRAAVPRHGDDASESRLVSSEDRRRAARAGKRWWARPDRGSETWLRSSFDLWCAGVLRGSLTPPDLGKLAWALGDVRLRDAVIVALVPGQADTALRNIIARDSEAIGLAMTGLLAAGSGAQPPDLTRPWELCEELVCVGGRAASAPAWTILGLMAWWRGEPDSAHHLVGQALRAVPDYRLAQLLDMTLDAGLPPGWLRT